jgi:hypothetical protein
MVQVVSALVAVAAAAIAIIQVFIMRSTAHGELVHETLRMLSSEGGRRARSVVYSLAGKPVSEWTKDECEAAEIVAVEFSQIGFLARRNYMGRGAVLDYFALRFTSNWVIERYSGDLITRE